MSRLSRIGDWFEQRLQIGGAIREAAEHPIPPKSASWWYVFGSAALTIFILQVVTGILLALMYVPSAAEAWNSLQFLNHGVTLGWFLRAMHGWGSNFMVAVVLIHMCQVFLFGAYKFPRELTWIVGVFLLLMTLGMAFTGQVLRFDQDAYWGIGIGASISSRSPVIGGYLVHMLLGGPIIAGATLSRFFALHVFVIPGLLIGFVTLHLLMVLKLGINEWPMPGRLVRRSTYVQEYHETDAQARRAFRARGRVEGCVLFRRDHLQHHGLRCVFRALRADGISRPDDHPDDSQARFLLSVDLRHAGATAACDGNSTAADRAGHRHWVPRAVAFHFRRGREELEAAAHRGGLVAPDRGGARDVHQAGYLFALEPDHERLERRPRSGEFLEWHALRLSGRARWCSRESSAATVTLLAARADSAGPNWIAWPLA